MATARLYRQLADFDIDGDNIVNHQRLTNTQRGTHEVFEDDSSDVRLLAATVDLSESGMKSPLLHPKEHAINDQQRSVARNLLSESNSTSASNRYQIPFRPGIGCVSKQPWPTSYTTRSKVLSAAAAVTTGRRIINGRDIQASQSKSSKSGFGDWKTTADWMTGMSDEEEEDCLTEFSKMFARHRVTPSPLKQAAWPLVNGHRQRSAQASATVTVSLAPAVGSISKVPGDIKTLRVTDTSAGKPATRPRSSQLATSSQKSTVVKVARSAERTTARGQLMQRCRHHKASLELYDRELLASLIRNNGHACSEQNDLPQHDFKTCKSSARWEEVVMSPNIDDIVTHMSKTKNTNQNARNTTSDDDVTMKAQNVNQNAAGAEEEAPEGHVEAGGASTHSSRAALSPEIMMNGEEEDKQNDGRSNELFTPRMLAKMALAARTRIRRCIAEDLQWSLKTVPTLDQLVIKKIAADFEGNRTS